MTAIAVTGVTGRLGSLVARRLADSGATLRLVARDPSRVQPIGDAVVAAATYDDAAAFEAAVSGASTLLLVSATESDTRVADHITAIDAAIAAGVERIVYISFQGAAPDATFTFARDHWHTEQHLKSTGIAHTILRDNNYLAYVPALVDRADGVIRGPAGEGRFAPVSHEDIADVAAAVLSNDELLANETRDITGPQALSLNDVARTLTARTGRTITYEPQTRDEAFASRAHYGAPQWMVEGWVSSYEAIATGELGTVSDTVETVTGHPPTSLEQYLDAQPEALAGLFAHAEAADAAIEKPSRWRKQLTDHLGHRIDTTSGPTTSTFRFGDGFALATDTEAGLRLEAEAATGDRLAQIQDVVSRHLERFAHRHEISISWGPSPSR
ncbi:DUF2218 domain-containing protein [Antrihabitans sp. YC2-6]|uniref:DUF2218 domain-containing protein n=1 Tax=Antrihabitans sp. YC2-6 TaxID=2799498 RepID=UPI0018F55B1B|nr:DUF2218 domain-containing protein [Antrihabitans sp. YC2-6]MBJ8346135.1 DUF2218 domain-containing protein [Antrihabitans sp. YC2-6]